MHLEINTSVLYTDLEDGTCVLLNLDTKEYYTLNQTGHTLWKKLMKYEPTTPEYLAECVWAEATLGFRPELCDELRADSVELFEEMLAEGLVKEVNLAEPGKPEVEKSVAKAIHVTTDDINSGLYDAVYDAIDVALCDSDVASIAYLENHGYDDLISAAARAAVAVFNNPEES